MNTKEVTKLTGFSFTWCSRWASKNGVGRKKVKGVLAYEWTKEDVERLGKKK